jgi:hypothetical protein
MGVDGLSGGTAAFITNLLFHPLENIRTRLQDHEVHSENDLEKNENPGNAEKDVKREKTFSAFQFLMKLYHKEGIGAFYKGLNITLIGSVITFAVYFFWYRFWKIVFARNGRQLDSKRIMAITAFAGSITNAITTPIWAVQTRM